MALNGANEISLNLRRSEIQDYERSGRDLVLHLADGRTMVIEDFFSQTGAEAGRLFLNEDGTLIAVDFQAGGVSYSEAAVWGKWSDLDALIFPDDGFVAPYEVAEAADSAVEQALGAAATEDEVSSQALGIGLVQAGIGGLGGIGAGVGGAVLGAGALAGVSMLGGGGGGAGTGGGGGTGMADPTVDRPNARYRIGGNDPQHIQITGTAEPGASVRVTIGNETVRVITQGDGTWKASFRGEDFPADGTYDVAVTVVNPDRSIVHLDGPSVLIDTVAPNVDAGGNVGMGGDWINAEVADGGVTINGTGEPGAEIVVEIEGVRRTTTVRPDGTWSVFYAEGVLPGGEYTTTVKVTATDSFGNQTVRTEQLAIDTVAPELELGVVEGDNVVNAGELADGVVISGTSEAGARLVVTIGGVSYQTIAGIDGSWSVVYQPGDITAGEYSTTITAVATDAAGNSTTTTSALHIDTLGTVTIEPGTDGGEPVVNADNSADGVVLTGTTEPGSTVVVSYDGTDYTATVDGDGNWTVTVPAGSVTEGEYDVTVTVTATDGAGNTSVTTSTVAVDTTTSVTVSPGYAGPDMLISASEADAGVTFSGTGEPGASVQVSFEGSSHSTIVANDGSWSVHFTPAEIPDGNYTGTLTVQVTDAAGNTASESVSVAVDTTAFVSFAATPVEGDNVINATEAGDGVVLTGATFPGATVTIEMGANSYPASVAGDGSWTVTIPAGHIPPGETSVTFTAHSVSASGNPASAELTVAVDTLTAVGLDLPAAGDGLINAADRAAGVELTGVAEPGASVVVQLGTVSVNATVAADGSWSATFPASRIPQGEYTAPVTVTATDRAGNVATLTETIEIDTTASVSADYAQMGGDGTVNAAEAGAGVLLTGSSEPGSSVAVTIAGVTRAATVDANGDWSVTWPQGSLPAGEATTGVTVIATDAAGNTASSTGTVKIDTLVRNFTNGASIATADGVIAGPELAGGLTLTGTTEPGASVTVQLAGATRAASVGANGTWSVTFPQGAIPPGEYATQLTATTIDRAGNVSTLTQSVRVDTVAGNLALSSVAIEVDDVVNAAERADGVTVTGTATPGMVVTVGFGAATTTALAAADGRWSADFSARDIPAGTWDAAVTATITDAYGNTKSVADTVRVDTEVTPNALTRPIEGDNVISGAERADGVTLTGTVEPGSVVSVRLGLVTRSATVDANGNWTVDFAPGEIPSGETTTAINVTATDAAGNTALITESVRVDTLVTGFALATPIGGDGYINASEAAMGLTLTGTVEAGSTVVVSYEGTARTAVVGANGAWTVTFTAAEVGSGEYTGDVFVRATDAVGNVATLSGSVAVDTEAPEAAYVTSFTRAGDVIREISVPIADDVASISAVARDGSTPAVPFRTEQSLFYPDETDILLGRVSDGTHLVINRADAAGNTSSTLLALEDSTTDVINLANPGFDGRNIDAIDLRIAENSQLTISADLLEGLSGNGNTLTVHGSEDDTIRIDTSDGATFTNTGRTVTIGTDTYNVYTLGDEGGTLIIDDEIRIIT